MVTQRDSRLRETKEGVETGENKVIAVGPLQLPAAGRAVLQEASLFA